MKKFILAVALLISTSTAFSNTNEYSRLAAIKDMASSIAYYPVNSSILLFNDSVCFTKNHYVAVALSAAALAYLHKDLVLGSSEEKPENEDQA